MFFRRKVEKGVTRMPRREQVLFADLVEDLQRKRPVGHEWTSFGKLSEDDRAGT